MNYSFSLIVECVAALHLIVICCRSSMTGITASQFVAYELVAPFDSLTLVSIYRPMWSDGIFVLSLTVQKLFHVFHWAGTSRMVQNSFFLFWTRPRLLSHWASKSVDRTGL